MYVFLFAGNVAQSMPAIGAIYRWFYSVLRSDRSPMLKLRSLTHTHTRTLQFTTKSRMLAGDVEKKNSRFGSSHLHITHALFTQTHDFFSYFCRTWSCLANSFVCYLMFECSPDIMQVVQITTETNEINVLSISHNSPYWHLLESYK